MPSSKYMAHASQFSQSMSQSYPSASQGSQRQVTQGTAQPSVSLQKYSSQPLLRVKNGQEKSFSNLTNSLQRLMPPCNCSEETKHRVESLCNRIVGIAEDISQMKADLGHLKDHSREDQDGRFRQLIIQTEFEGKELNITPMFDKREHQQRHANGHGQFKKRHEGKMTDFMQVTKNQNHELMQLSPICLSNPQNETTGEMWPMSLQNDQNWKASQGDLMSMMPSPPALEDSLPVAQSSKKRASTAKRKRPTKGKQQKIDEYTSFHLPADTNFPNSLIESGAADVDASFCTKEDEDAVKKMVLRARKKRKSVADAIPEQRRCNRLATTLCETAMAVRRDGAACDQRKAILAPRGPQSSGLKLRESLQLGGEDAEKSAGRAWNGAVAARRSYLPPLFPPRSAADRLPPAMAASFLASALFLLSSLISAILFSPHSPPLLLALPGEVRRIFLPALVPSAIARAGASGGWAGGRHRLGLPSFIIAADGAAHPSLRMVPPAQSDLPSEALLGEAVSGAAHGTLFEKGEGSTRRPLPPSPDASLADAGVGGLGEGGRGVGVVLPAVDVSAVERAVEEAVSEAFSRAQYLLASLDSVRRAGRAAQKAFSDRSFVALVEEEMVLHFGGEGVEKGGEGGEKSGEKGLRGVDVGVGGRVGEEARRRAEAVVRTVVVMMGERGEEGVESAGMGAEWEEEEGEEGVEGEEQGGEEGREGASGVATARRFRLAERLKGLGDVARDKVWDMADTFLSRLRAAGQKVVSAEEFLAARARYAAARVRDAGKRVLDRVVESGRAAREDAEAARDAVIATGRAAKETVEAAWEKAHGAGQAAVDTTVGFCSRAAVFGQDAVDRCRQAGQTVWEGGKKTVGAVEGGVKGAVKGVREVVEGVEEAVEDVSERVKGVGRCVVEEGFHPHTHEHGYQHGHGHGHEEAGVPPSPAAPTAFLGPVYDVATEAVRMEHGGEGERGGEGVGEGVVGQVGRAWDAAKGRVEEGAEKLRGEVKEGAEKLQEVKECAEKLPERVKEGAEVAWEEARERGSRIGEKVKEGAEKVWEEAREEGSRVGGKLREKAGEGWEAVEGLGEKMREGMRREGGGEEEEDEMGDGVWMELQGVRFFQPVRDAMRPKKAGGKETATGAAEEAEGAEGAEAAEKREQVQQLEQWERVTPPFPASALMSCLPLWFQRLVLPIPLLSHPPPSPPPLLSSSPLSSAQPTSLLSLLRTHSLSSSPSSPSGSSEMFSLPVILPSWARWWRGRF
ncbi:unnamed protein product [Closterium sp. Yama58-4]|nr:unnamed protein product [Closterium sp. Yama58-4]